jgi:hypothetical protein
MIMATTTQMTCSRCGGDTVILYYSESICATCVRADARARPRTGGCEKCGGPRGFRYPIKGGDYKCIACHTADGTLPPEVQDTSYNTPCAGKPTDDPRHSWKFVKGARRACRHCKVHDYEGDRPA